MEEEHQAAPLCAGVTPAAVSVATKQNLPPAAAYGAVGLVTIIIIHVGYLQVHVLMGHRRTSQDLSAQVCFSSTRWTISSKAAPTLHVWHRPPSNKGWKVAALIFPQDRQNSAKKQMQMNKPAADGCHVPSGGSSPSILRLFFKTSFTICSERGKQHNWVHPKDDTTARRSWLNRGDGRELKLMSLRWVLLCTCGRYLCCRTPRGQTWSCRGSLGASWHWGNTLAGTRQRPGVPEGCCLQARTETDTSSVYLSFMI